MAHYAFINTDNVVVSLISGIDENETQVDLDGTVVGGSAEAWEEFYQNQPWHAGLICKFTSDKNDGYRKQFANVGFTYNAEKDIFIQPQPYNSWILDENFDWQPPTAMPTDGKTYGWYEPNREWIEVSSEFVNTWLKE